MKNQSDSLLSITVSVSMKRRQEKEEVVKEEEEEESTVLDKAEGIEVGLEG